MEAPAAADAAPIQLRSEQGSVPSFMGNEIVDLTPQRWRSPRGDPTLSPIDGNGAMLASMVNLDHDFTDSSGGPEMLGGHSGSLRVPYAAFATSVTRFVWLRCRLGLSGSGSKLRVSALVTPAAAVTR